MQERNSGQVREYRLVGIVLVAAGVLLGGLSLVVSSVLLGLGLLALGPVVAVLQARRRDVVNLGMTTVALGALFLVEGLVGFEWLTPLLLAAVVAASGLTYVVVAPWLASGSND